MQNRHLFEDLRGLGQVRAPASIVEAVLDEVGLGDRYALLETALGPVFVAWNRLGVSAVMKTATGDDFESRFRERFGRSPKRAPELPLAPTRSCLSTPTARTRESRRWRWPNAFRRRPRSAGSRSPCPPTTSKGFA